MTLPAGYTIDVVRGERTPELDEELIRFWTGRRALAETAARARLGHVVCVLRDGEGAAAAVNSVFEKNIAELGGRRFWLYRTLAPSPESRAALDEMVTATHKCLEAERQGLRGEPIGICMMVADRETMEHRNEPVWPTSELMFAGYTSAGEQLRIVYFDGARVI